MSSCVSGLYVLLRFHSVLKFPLHHHSVSGHRYVELMPVCIYSWITCY